MQTSVSITDALAVGKHWIGQDNLIQLWDVEARMMLNMVTALRLSIGCSGKLGGAIQCLFNNVERLPPRNFLRPAGSASG